MIKKYIQFIKEADETQNVDSSKWSNLIEEIKDLMQKTVDKSGGDINSLKEKFLQEPDEVKIEGLINDSDIYEFYLKFRNDIDELLNDIKFFDEMPSKLNSFGLYDYIVTGTNKAILELVKMMK